MHFGWFRVEGLGYNDNKDKKDDVQDVPRIQQLSGSLSSREPSGDQLSPTFAFKPRFSWGIKTLLCIQASCDCRVPLNP